MIAVGVLAVVVASKVTAPSPEDQKQMHLSHEFRIEARKTFDAIKRCDDYVTNSGTYYEPRLLAGIATGKSWREIGAALGQVVKSWNRGR